MVNLLDRVVLGINKGINIIDKSSQKMVNKAKLHVKFGELEEEKIKALQQLGLLVYEMQMDGELDVFQIKIMCNEIEKILKQMELRKAEDQNKDISKQILESGVICKCGYINKKQAKFCSECGMMLWEDVE